MLKGVGPKGTERRPDRVVDLTDDFVEKLPEPASYGDVFWDKVCDRLTVIKAKRGPLFRMKLRKAERRTLGLHQSTALVRLGYYSKSFTVESARKKYHDILTAIQENRPLDNRDDTVGFILDDAPDVSGRTYETLMSVLMDAYEQATSGKGDQRHGASQPFEKQDMQRIITATSIDFAIGQAMKKMLEARRLVYHHNPRRNELLGAIVYLAGAIVALDKQHEDKAEKQPEPVAEPEPEEVS